MNFSKLLLTLLTSSIAFYVHAQDLTHEVEADTLKWPVPSVKDEWKLE